MFLRPYSRQDKKREENLKGVFNKYAKTNGGKLQANGLADAFEYLGAKMPHMHANEVLKYFAKDKDKDKGIDTQNGEEFNKLVEYAYMKGYGKDMY